MVIISHLLAWVPIKKLLLAIFMQSFLAIRETAKKCEGYNYNRYAISDLISDNIIEKTTWDLVNLDNKAEPVTLKVGPRSITAFAQSVVLTILFNTENGTT